MKKIILLALIGFGVVGCAQVIYLTPTQQIEQIKVCQSAELKAVMVYAYPLADGFYPGSDNGIVRVDCEPK